MPIEPDKVVSLADGRTIGYSECGDPAGQPVLAFPDTLGSRLDLSGREFDTMAGAAGARLLVLERPGIGLSDARPGRSVLDWPVDVVGFAEVLGLSRFSLLGFGGGGPYALACACRIPHRVRSVGVVAGPVPPDLPNAWAVMTAQQRKVASRGQYFPWLVERQVKQMSRQLVSGSDRLIEREASALGPADQTHLRNPNRRAHRLASLRAGFRRGDRGVLDDLLLVSRAWGFSLGDVPMVVNLWFGGADRRVLPEASHALAAALPLCEARVYPDDGHYSLSWERLEAILVGLLATAEREAGRPVG